MTEERRCDECGRGITKVHRIHQGRKFCAACYKRVFKYRLCPKCGNRARLPKDDSKAVCLKCQVSKPCARCGRTDYAVSKITPYGPVCGSCAHHFREPEPCEECGKMSTLLTRVTRLGAEKRLCPKCARVDHGTCAACRRYRLLHDATDGRKLCQVCLQGGEIPCPVCNKPMPAGRGKQCEDCYWTETLRKRVRIDQAALSTPAMAEAFGQFGEWLLAEVGSNKAAITLHRYLTFFQEVDQQWGAIPEYQKLLECFGAEGLRRVRIVVRWMTCSGRLVVDTEAREADSERRRIQVLIASMPPESIAARALAGYRERLMERVIAGKSTLRSVRLALRPASSVLLASDAEGARLPDQAVMDRYLLESPGQKAAVTGFANYLVEEWGVTMVPRVDARKASVARRKRLEKEIRALMREGGDADDEDFQMRWLSVALSYFHGLPRSVGAKADGSMVSKQDDGSLTINWNGQAYWVPPAVAN